jgi:hypothetical protein
MSPSTRPISIRSAIVCWGDWRGPRRAATPVRRSTFMPWLSSCHHVQLHDLRRDRVKRSPRPIDILSGLMALGCCPALPRQFEDRLRFSLDLPTVSGSWGTPPQLLLDVSCVWCPPASKWWLIVQYSCWITSDSLLNTKQGTYLWFSDG